MAVAIYRRLRKRVKASFLVCYFDKKNNLVVEIQHNTDPTWYYQVSVDHLTGDIEQIANTILDAYATSVFHLYFTEE